MVVARLDHPLPLPSGPLPHGGWFVRECYRRQVAVEPNREAVRFNDHAISHAELLIRIERWQQLIEAAALGCCIDQDPNHPWAIQGDDTVDNLLIGLSQLFAGQPLLLLPLHAPETERAGLIQRGSVGAVLTDRPLPASFGMERRAALAAGWELWSRSNTATPFATTWLASNDAHQHGPGALKAELETILRRPAAVSVTSGTTTGVPTLQVSSWLEALAMLQQPEWPPSRRMLFSFRLQFVASRAWANRILLEGATLCCVRVSERAQMPELAGQLAADTLAINPPFMEEMLGAHLERRFPATLAFVTGTDRVPAGLRRRFHDRFGPRLTIALANSRLGPVTMLPADQLLAHDGESVGFPLANVSVELGADAAPEWQALNIGDARLTKTWRVSLQHPEQGRIELVHTLRDSRPGDLLRRWPDGQLSFAGRANDVFLFRSLLISPHESEDLLAEDAAVCEVVAFGAPSSVYGAVPMAAVRLRSDCSPERELPRLRHLCQAAMGARAPKALIPVDEIPRGPSGKPLRRELARRHALT